MEQAQILSKIKEGLGQTSLSDRTLTEYVSKVLPAEGTEPDEAYFETHIGILKALNGQYSHDIAEYQRQNPKPKPNPTEKPEENEAIKKLQTMIDELKSEIKSNRSEQSISAVRSALSAKGDELKVRNKAIWEDAVKGLSIKEGDTVESVLSSAKSSYEAMQKRYIGESAQPYGALQKDPATDAEKQKALREAYRKQLMADGLIPGEEK